MSAEDPYSPRLVFDSTIVSLLIVAILYGVYFSTFITGLRALLFGGDRQLKSPPSRLNRVILCTTCLMATCATTDMVCMFLLNRAIIIPPSIDPGALSTVASFRLWHMVVLGCQTLLGDLVLIYRCYVVYERKIKFVALSILLATGWLVCTCVYLAKQVYWDRRVASSPQALLELGNGTRDIQPWIEAVSMSTLIVTIITTGLLVYRIWIMQYSVVGKTSGTNTLTRVMWVLVESGALYSVTVLTHFILFRLGNMGQIVLSGALTQVVGIAFNLVLLRVDRGRSQGASVRVATIPASSFAFATDSMAASRGDIELATTMRRPGMGGRDDESGDVSTSSGTKTSSTMMGKSKESLDQ